MKVGEYKIWKGVIVCMVFYIPMRLISDSFTSGWLAMILAIAAQQLIWPWRERFLR